MSFALFSLCCCDELLFILSSRLLLYFAGSGVNRVQFVLSGFSVRCYVLSRQKLYVGRLYVFLGYTRACVCRM